MLLRAMTSPESLQDYDAIKIILAEEGKVQYIVC